jgi:hypothetical protein
VTVSGTATQGYTVSLYDGSHFLASVIAGTGGAWSFTVNLTVGTHALSVTQTSTTVPGGRYTSSASTVSVTVYAPPSAPTLTGNINGAVGAGATISGRAVALGNVEIYEGLTRVGTATVDLYGNWVSTLNLLSLGRHTLTMKVQDIHSGFWSSVSSPFVVTVVPDAPAITFTSIPGATVGNATVTVSGTGVNGYTVKVYDGTRYLGTAVVSGGVWSVNVLLGVGSHSLNATQTSTPVAGVVYTSDASESAPVAVYAPTPAPVVASSPVNVWVGATFTVSGYGSAGALVKVYDGGVEVGHATVGSSGVWTATVTLSSATGAHVLSAKQWDATSGFGSAASSSFTVTAFVNPGAPSISTATTPAKTHNYASVTLTGTGVTGQTITIYDGLSAIKTVTVVGGAWTVSVSLYVGVHSLTATQSPASGLQSAASVPRGVTVLYG